MREILVLGGTRFFGKKLVSRLIQHPDNHVTLLTRGNAHDDFGDKVSRLRADRSDPKQLEDVLGSSSWDIVYDNICYSPNDALTAQSLFKGRTARYILTSSMSVYDPSPEALTEAVFDPYRHPLRRGDRDDFTYQEGKQLAEAVLLQQSGFPVSAVRFPIVLGEDDYTRRLHFHIEHIRNGDPIGVPNLDARMSFITSDEAADFLNKLGCSTLTGPVNACSGGTVSIREVIAMIERETGQRAEVCSEAPEEHISPFGVEESWYMDTAYAQKAGFAFRELTEYLPALIASINLKLNS
ncbi:NAD-dependent dehydratase [Paenibacillus sp. HN-1]|uniref:NAD-dependent epimerase/dehydratase family protein n=1 Tax=Paenibacillus TaxID=44249 RepID=UPI001CA933F6|nr:MULTISPECIES: NAD-dependent epimerase/dehydratase family protein [Paenibacillus]MBY9078484.1 NAD-dependent dehydratase [Paenibacillus sp. CGMCC 1.18879]MBY9082777.1 NAD-dependent dehydratase [Paenibacillus sinensis]